MVATRVGCKKASITIYLANDKSMGYKLVVRVFSLNNSIRVKVCVYVCVECESN